MKTGKTASGFKYEVDSDVIESWDFIELLAEVEDNALVSVKLLKMILGEEQTKALKAHLGGKPKAEDMFNALNEIIIDIGNNTKNS